MPEDKLHPRNRTARLAEIRAVGNPVTTELESGVGNCFPGLEMDLRNLDRRFFPYLVVDFFPSHGRALGGVVVRDALSDGESDTDLSTETRAGLRRIVASLGAPWTGPDETRWTLRRIQGQFAGYAGERNWDVAEFGGGDEGSAPPDAWTAIRLLVPGSTVVITLERRGDDPVTLAATRASYMADDGTFAEMFAPGELTQSLCSPWTHDFRDCGCFYWASNHPDVVRPALPPGVADEDPDWADLALWQRSRRDAVPDEPPPDPGNHRGEMVYFEINERWQDLDVVLDGREQRAAYAPSSVEGVPLVPATLEATLRYAAGVELGVMVAYLAAAYSLAVGDLTKPAADAVTADARAARHELLRVAASEMRHLRVVNDLLFDHHVSAGAPGPFRPALGIAEVLPGPGGRPGEPVAFRPLTREVLAEFVAYEAPSLSVDALYSDLLATYRVAGEQSHAALTQTIMAEGDDHYETFLNLQEWLGRHEDRSYLLPSVVPEVGDPRLSVLQQRYEDVLDKLHSGYRTRDVDGASPVADARKAMLGPAGVQGACEALAEENILPVFAVPRDDPRFVPVPRP